MKSFRVYKKLRGKEGGKETKELYTGDYMHIYKIISNGQTAK